ncbi:FHA domain-containing protein [Psychrobacter sp. 1Y1]|uniref:FHA domain-containing protein n=1 Tax=Psychrobacter sp. 1Y1 TaxID=3453574 RepID=UPI003F44E287
MTNETESTNTAASTTWQLNALTEALGDLTLTVSDSLSIGRGSDNDVVLGSKQVSRNHAVLSVLDGQLYVKDLDSSNGTFINEQRIAGNESSHLKANDTLGFASFSFQVQTSAAPVTTEELVADAHENADTAAVLETTASEPVTEEQIIEESVLEEEPIIEQTVNEPVIKETGIEEMLPATDDTVPVESLSVDAGSDMTEESVTPTHATVEPAVEEPAVEELATEEAVATEPVVKKTGIDEVLSDADAASPTPVEDTPVATEVVADASVPTATQTEAVTTTEPPKTASTDSAPVVEEQPAVHEEPVMHEEPAIQDEHDKTTKTELQEEADPEVLKAKQAASAQFSGTANLGQPRDLGTEGNNAMDQEISNPAHAGHVEKKASGGWFIWVFVTILIIGLALWLFNMGGA